MTLSRPPVLLVDIGNSRVKWRLLDPTPGDHTLDDAWQGTEGVVDVDAAPTLGGRWASLADRPVRRAWVSNVADESVLRTVEAAMSATWPGIRVERVIATAAAAGVVNGYADPSRLGPDRWVALIGAHAARPATSLLVCSFGTATTIDLLGFDALMDRARFEGGLILPGPTAMRSALIDATARLPDFEGEIVDFADRTTDAIASGVVAAQLGAVQRALRAAHKRLGAPVDIVFAGGAAAAMARESHGIGAPCHVVPDLVLSGLGVLARTL